MVCYKIWSPRIADTSTKRELLALDTVHKTSSYESSTILSSSSYSVISTPWKIIGSKLSLYWPMMLSELSDLIFDYSLWLRWIQNCIILRIYCSCYSWRNLAVSSPTFGMYSLMFWYAIYGVSARVRRASSWTYSSLMDIALNMPSMMKSRYSFWVKFWPVYWMVL